MERSLAMGSIPNSDIAAVITIILFKKKRFEVLLYGMPTQPLNAMWF